MVKEIKVIFCFRGRLGLCQQICIKQDRLSLVTIAPVWYIVIDSQLTVMIQINLWAYQPNMILKRYASNRSCNFQRL